MVLKEGNLYKEGKFNKLNWKKRSFALKRRSVLSGGGGEGSREINDVDVQWSVVAS